MSVPYHKEIFSNGTIKLVINFSGITDDVMDATDCKLEIYAYDSSKYKTIFSESLNIDQVRELYAHLEGFSIIKDPTKKTSGKFYEADGEISELIEKLKNGDKDFVKSVLEKVFGNEKIGAIVNSLSDDELINLEATINQTLYKKELANLKKLIDLEIEKDFLEKVKADENLKTYSAGQSEKVFQNWMEKNLWSLGTSYIKKHDWRTIGLSAEADLVMESSHGYIDLIELKRPTFEYFSFDNDHNNYYPSPKLSSSMGQGMLYLKTLEEYKDKLEKKHKVKILKPRIKIIAGKSAGLKEEEIEAFRMLNASLVSIEIMSYDNLVQSAEQIIAFYEGKAPPEE